MADWFEAEGSVSIVKRKRRREQYVYLIVISQDIARREIVDEVSFTLKKSGFNPFVYFVKRQLRCNLVRRNEQECFLRMVMPRLISAEKKEDIRRALDFLAEKQRIGRSRGAMPRTFFLCPKELG